MRRKDIDGISGLMIVYMIFVHIVNFTHTGNFFVVLMRPLFFFMPWFFFKSGMFFFHKSNNQMFLEGKKLLYPYVKYSLYGIIVWSVILFFYGEISWVKYILSPFYQILKEGAVMGNLPLWFLASLFVAKLMYNTICSQKYYLTLLFLCIIAAYILDVTNCNYIVWFGNILSGLFFLGMGHLLKDVQYKKIVFIISMLFYVAYLSIPSLFSNVDMRANHCNHGYYLLYVLGSLSGIIMINNIFYYLPQNTSILHAIGRKSMNYYVIHYLLLEVVILFSNKIFHVDIDSLLMVFILSLNSFIVLPIIAKYVNTSRFI